MNVKITPDEWRMKALERLAEEAVRICVHIADGKPAGARMIREAADTYAKSMIAAYESERRRA